MLELINEARTTEGLGQVALGDNDAAQLHAEASLENCFSSHWGVDGLKPYMRYSLAGGYQSNAENGSGSDHCIRPSDGYRAIDNLEQKIRQVMQGLMDSPGHRRNILRPWHKKVNLGLAWDRYNFKAIQHFEGDYLGYQTIPKIENGILELSGEAKNGVLFVENGDLGVQLYYDPPPHQLTRGQISRTYCYDSGIRIAALRPPLEEGWHYNSEDFSYSYRPCPDPYDVSPQAPAPNSNSEARQFWQDAYDQSQQRVEYSVRLPWVTAVSWTATGNLMQVGANISHLLDQYGDGVYTVLVWGTIEGEDVPISQYSIFYNVTPPDTYAQYASTPDS